MDSDPIEETPPPKPFNKYAMAGQPNYMGQSYNFQDEYGDNLFDNDTIQDVNTIPTQPIRRPMIHYSSPSNNLSSPPPLPQYTTQPTQLLSTPHRASQISEILVPASSSPHHAYRSDNTRSLQPSQPNFFGSLMAPPGTAFRPPIPIQRPYPNQSSNSFSQTSNWDDPPITVDSDSDGDYPRPRADIIPTSFVARPASQAAALTPFANIGQYAYNPSVPQKRAPEDSVSAYGNSSRPRKVHRQPAPPSPRSSFRPEFVARNVSDSKMQDMEIAHIQDWDLREKVGRINSVFPGYPVEKIKHFLRMKKGHTDDAIAAIMSDMEKEDHNSPAKPIELSDDEDELQFLGGSIGIAKSNNTAPAQPTAKQRLEGRTKTMAEKYSNFQSKLPPRPELQPRLVTSTSSVPLTPPKKPLRRLKQGRPAGRRDDSSPVTRSPVVQSPVAPSPQYIPTRPKKRVDSDEYDSEAEEEPEPRQDIDEQAFEYFNKTATDKDLCDMTNCSPEDATLILSKRPFRNLDAVRRVAVQPKDTKSKRSGGNRKTIGERIVDKVVEMMTGLEAVDRVVSRCEGYAKDLKAEMSKLGLNVAKASSEDGLALMSFEGEPKVDSGVVTPASSSDNLLQQPSNFSAGTVMRDFQVVGLNWLNLMYSKGRSLSRQSGCILADEMGLGKTIQMIGFISHLLETGNKGPHLVVCPASTLENWMREFGKFSPQIRAEPYHGSQSERLEMQSRIEDAKSEVNVIVTTYALAAKAKDCIWLRKTFKFVSCIFDEGHYLKNRETERYRTLKKIRAEFRVLLTGTPLQNNLQELISVLAFIMPDFFDECEDDLNLIFSHKAKTTDKDHAALLSAQRIARAKSMLTPFILRRTKDQVLKDLPKKTTRVEYCDMTPRQETIYREYADQHQKVLEKRKAGILPDGDDRLPHLMFRRLAAMHPLLVRSFYDNETVDKIVPKIPRKGKFKGWSDEKMFEELTWLSDFELHKLCEQQKLGKKLVFRNNEWMDSGKVTKLVELVKRFSKEVDDDGEGGRTLVFSQFVKVLDVLESVLDTEGIKFCRIDGATPVNDRQGLIDLFMKDNTTKVFLITTRSGGAGINLACANKVIIFDSSFNPQDDIQAENRAHRIGQTRNVEVVTLITKGTIEEQIYKLGQSKLALDKRVAGADDGEAAAQEAEALLEQMLMEGRTTLPNEAVDGETTNGEASVNGEDTNGEASKKEAVKKELAKDLKDAFRDGLKAKGVDIAE